jgi:thiol-disulfide isomerase/thioredoxin
MQFVTLWIGLFLSLPAAGAGSPGFERAPDAYYAALRAQDAEDLGAARAILAEALKKDPDNLWLHDLYAEILRRSELAEVAEAEYQAFASARPAGPRTQLIFAWAIGRLEPEVRGEEARSLLDGVKGVKELSPRASVAEADLASRSGGRSARKEAWEALWKERPGHPARAFQLAMALRGEKDDARVVEIALAAAALEPREGGRLARVFRPGWGRERSEILERGLVSLIAELEKAAKGKPGDLYTQLALYEAYAVAGKEQDCAKLEPLLRKLDPKWGAKGYDIKARTQDRGFTNKLGEARATRDPKEAVARLEALEPETAGRKDRAWELYSMLEIMCQTPPMDDPAKALQVRRKMAKLALESPEPLQEPATWRTHLSALAVSLLDSGANPEEVLPLAERAVKEALGTKRTTGIHMDPSGIGFWKTRPTEVALALHARGLARYRKGDLAGAREDLMLAALLSPAPDICGLLAEVGEKLKDSEISYEGYLLAAAYDPSKTEYKAGLERVFGNHFAFLDAAKRIEAEKKTWETWGKAPAPPKRTDAASALIGKAAPPFEAQRLGGGTVRLDSLKGKPVVLGFWATWCLSCRQEFYLLDRYREKLGEKLEILMISLDSENVWKQDVPAFIAKEKFKLPIARADDALRKAYAVRGTPTLVTIDKDGIIRYHHTGFIPDEELEKLLNQLLEPAKAGN